MYLDSEFWIALLHYLTAKSTKGVEGSDDVDLKVSEVLNTPKEIV